MHNCEKQFDDPNKFRFATSAEREIAITGCQELVGQSASLQKVMDQIETVAPTDSTVLLYGETGTGKEIIARAIHEKSLRKGRPFVKVNCAAIPAGLLESEIFGHTKGAFTGAMAPRTGRFELAHMGTLLMDEIGDIPLELQPKLLRVLQEREFERLGSSSTTRCDVRIIAATHRDLAHFVQQRLFRADLYYRLNVFPIAIPPLRDRRDDIPRLIRYFADVFSRRMNKQIDTIPEEDIENVKSYGWPGNIRELQNIVERAVILSRNGVLRLPVEELSCSMDSENLRTRTTLRDAERDFIIHALRETNWVIGGDSGAAARLGLPRTTLIYKIRKLEIFRT